MELRWPRARIVPLLAALAVLVTACSASPNGSAGGHRATGPVARGQPAPSTTDDLLSVSCASAPACWAVGQGDATAPNGVVEQVAVVDASRDGGATWSRQPVPIPTPATLSSISCTGPRHCMAVGDTAASGLEGVVVATSDGRRWHTMAVPPGAVDVLAVACTIATECLVLATDGSSVWSATTTDGGSTWERGGVLPGGFAGAGGIACPVAGTCLATGYVPSSPGHGAGAVEVTTDGGASWTPAALPAGTGLLHAVSCAPGLNCLAVGTSSGTTTAVAPGDGVVLTSSGTVSSFTAEPAPPGVGDAFGVACTAGSCTAVGTAWTGAQPPTPAAGVVVSTDGGTTWTSPAIRYVPTGLADVDCPTARTCVAVGDGVIARISLPAPPPTA